MLDGEMARNLAEHAILCRPGLVNPDSLEFSDDGGLHLIVILEEACSKPCRDPCVVWLDSFERNLTADVRYVLTSVHHSLC